MTQRGWIAVLLASMAFCGADGPLRAQESSPTRPGCGVITGVVVGDGRLPAAGATVTRFVVGQGTERTVTDQLGRFRFQTPLLDGGALVLGTIRAFSGKLAGELALDSHRLVAGGVLDVGRIVLGPALRLRVKVVDHGVPVPGVPVLVSRTYSPVDGALTDASGVATFDGIVAFGDYGSGFKLGATAPDGRVGSGYVVVTSRPDPIETVELVPAREIVLTVLDARGRGPVVGAKIEIPGTEETQLWHGRWDQRVETGADGKARLRPPPVASRILVWIRAGGFEEWTGDLSASGPKEVEVLLTRKPEQRWKVDASPERPADGSRVAVYSVYDLGRTHPFAGTIAGGELTVPWGAPGRELGLAIAGDGAFADLYHDGPTVFRRPRDVRFELRWDDGTPAAGIRLLILHPLPDPALRHGVVTDRDGRARASVLSESELDWQWQTGESVYDLDKVGLSDGENHARATINRLSKATLRFTLDGAPRLPADLNIGGNENLIRPFVEDPAAATVSFQYRQIWKWQPLEIWIFGHGFGGTKFVLSSPPGSHVVRDVALRSAVTLSLPQPKEPEIRPVYLSRWNPATKRWNDWGSRVVTANQPWGGDGPIEIRDLEPGVYRLASASDHSRSFELRERPAVQTMPLDFTRWLQVRGRVEAPPGIDLRGAYVVPVAPEDTSEPTDEVVRRDRIPVNENGNFDFFLIGADEVRVAPWHPAASAASPGSAISKLRGDPVVLRLGPPRRAARFTSDFELPPDFASHGSIRVLQLDGQKRPVAELEAIRVGAAFQLANAKAGATTLFIDPPSELSVPQVDAAPVIHRLPSRLPLIVENVVLGDAPVDLGKLVFPTGSALVVKFPDSWPPPLPPLEITAEALEAPTYSRRLTTGGEREVRLSGLRKGSFRVTVEANTQYSFRFERVIQADGEHPVEIAVDSPVSR